MYMWRASTRVFRDVDADGKCFFHTFATLKGMIDPGGTSSPCLQAMMARHGIQSPCRPMDGRGRGRRKDAWLHAVCDDGLPSPSSLGWVSGQGHAYRAALRRLSRFSLSRPSGTAPGIGEEPCPRSIRLPNNDAANARFADWPWAWRWSLRRPGRNHGRKAWK